MRNEIGRIVSWALYDLANQFFAVNIVSLYFPRWVTLEKNKPEICYSLAFGVSVFAVMIMSPFLGRISDISGRRMPFLIFFTLAAVLFTCSLSLTVNFYISLAFFALANFATQVSVVFYNALLPGVAPKGKTGVVSGAGRMAAYAGAILALYSVRPAMLAENYPSAFFLSGTFFLLFSLPCLLFIKDPRPAAERIRQGGHFFTTPYFDQMRTLKKTILAVPGLKEFLLASFFGLCPVNIVILFMSVLAARLFGLEYSGIVNLVAVAAVFAMFGSLAAGAAGDRFGFRNSLLAVTAVWSACFVLGAFAAHRSMFWVVGSMAGAAMGATWALSRALAVSLMRTRGTGEMFGIVTLVIFLSAIAGALYWGAILLLLSPLGVYGYRLALLSLVLFEIAAGLFLLRLPKKARAIEHNHP